MLYADQNVGVPRPNEPYLQEGGVVLIQRGPLRDQVRAAILERLFNGSLPPGQRLNEGRLAAEIGVSRTPLREALQQLEGMGLLRGEMARGYTVLPFSTEDAREVFPIAANLEVLAWNQARSKLPPEKVSELSRVGTSMARAASDWQQVLALDARFHHVLLAGCQNRRLLLLLAEVRPAAERYLYAFARSTGRVGPWVHAHSGIEAAVSAGDSLSVARRLEDHWQQQLQQVLEWLQAD